MTPSEIELVKGSFARVEKSQYDYAEIFYETLFAQTPSISTLFKGDMSLQRKKLKTTVALVVKGLDKFDTTLKGAVLDLGARHNGYGVHKDDFPDVVDALVKTFNIVLPDFTEDEEEAWIKALNTIAEIMISGMQAKTD